MKKKTVRPLTLSKETIRDLNDARVENVAGGRTGPSDCPAHCINNTGGPTSPQIPLSDAPLPLSSLSLLSWSPWGRACSYPASE